ATPTGVIPVLVTGIQSSAGSDVSWTCGLYRYRAPQRFEFAETWTPGTRPGVTRLGGEIVFPHPHAFAHGLFLASLGPSARAAQRAGPQSRPGGPDGWPALK
ncbi:MAG: hypothetical protein AAF732_06320, partial [Pseudomonadota bacterium]